MNKLHRLCHYVRVHVSAGDGSALLAGDEPQDIGSILADCSVMEERGERGEREGRGEGKRGEGRERRGEREEREERRVGGKRGEWGERGEGRGERGEGRGERREVSAKKKGRKTLSWKGCTLK